MTSGPDEIQINPVALEAGRLAVEDALVDMRDSGMFMLGNNGFIIRNRDSSESCVLRMNTAMGLRIGIQAYLAALAEQATP